VEQYFPYIWLALIVITAILETVTAQLISIWIVVGGVAALLTAVLGGPGWLQMAVFVVVTLTTLIVTRPLVKKLVRTKKVSTNADRYVGQKAQVILPIDNQQGTGQVKVEGSIWSARTVDGSTLEAGDSVTVEAIEGVKLLVKKQ